MQICAILSAVQIFLASAKIKKSFALALAVAVGHNIQLRFHMIQPTSVVQAHHAVSGSRGPVAPRPFDADFQTVNSQHVVDGHTLPFALPRMSVNNDADALNRVQSFMALMDTVEVSNAR